MQIPPRVVVVVLWKEQGVCVLYGMNQYFHVNIIASFFLDFFVQSHIVVNS